MSLYNASVPQLIKMLNNLGRWLDAGVAQAQKKSFDPAVLLAARLYPDQYALSRQIQAACDGAKFTAARLTGKEAPPHPDTEETLEQFRARIQAVVSFLETFKAEDFEGAEKRPIALPFLQGKVMTGADYLTEMALPNFYFHVTTAYAILRHNGVELGKLDFIGSLTFQESAEKA